MEERVIEDKVRKNNERLSQLEKRVEQLNEAVNKRKRSYQQQTERRARAKAIRSDSDSSKPGNSAGTPPGPPAS